VGRADGSEGDRAGRAEGAFFRRGAIARGAALGKDEREEVGEDAQRAVVATDSKGVARRGPEAFDRLVRLAFLLFVAGCGGEEEGVKRGHECGTWVDCDDGIACNGSEVCHNGRCYEGIPDGCDAGAHCSEDAGACVPNSAE
jgi:hypothetical protein